MRSNFFSKKFLFIENTSFSVLYHLTVEFNSRRISIATFQSQSVESPSTAAFPVTANGFEWKPVWVVTAALFVSWATAVLLSSTDGSLVETVFVFHVVVDTVTGHENVEQVGDERAFNSAGPGGAVVAFVSGGAFLADADTGAA